MNFSFTEQQQVAADALAQMLGRFRDVPVHTESYLPGTALDAELQDAGFHDVGTDPDLGAVSAVDLVIQVARQRLPVEIAASALVRPRICPDTPRPLALVRGTSPVRFGAEARTALIATGNEVLRLDVQPGDFAPLVTLFAYPLAKLTNEARARAVPVSIEGAHGLLQQYWEVGLAAEITGAMQSALHSTVEYVTQRKQFGQPIGAFQAVQHRLAEAAVLLEAARWLTFKAADSGDAGDAALAAGYAQDAARRVAYDFHQFHGAMGLTLEHPLHLWTYRLRALLGELGGAASRFDCAAVAVWGHPTASRKA
jgi:hypothetical protein